MGKVIWPPGPIPANCTGFAAQIGQRLFQTFPDKEAWLLHRRTGISASEIPVLYQLDKCDWSSPYALWADKVGIDPGEDTEHKKGRFRVDASTQGGDA